MRAGWNGWVYTRTCVSGFVSVHMCVSVCCRVASEREREKVLSIDKVILLIATHVLVEVFAMSWFKDFSSRGDFSQLPQLIFEMKKIPPPFVFLSQNQPLRQEKGPLLSLLLLGFFHQYCIKL